MTCGRTLWLSLLLLSLVVSSAVAAPLLEVSTLGSGRWTGNSILNVSGRATDPSGIKSLSVAGAPVTLNADGTFSQLVVLQPGTTTVTTVATPFAGTQTVDSRQIGLDPLLPPIAIDAPADNSSANGSFIKVSGTVTAPVASVVVTVNGGTPQQAALSGSSFSASVNLSPGLNTVEATVTNLSGQANTVKRTVLSDGGKASLSIRTPVQDMQTSVSGQTISGQVSDAASPVTVTVHDGTVSYTPAVIGGSFSQKVVLNQAKSHKVVVTATDAAGRKTSVQRNILLNAATRFINNGDQTVSDNLTGLMWTRKASQTGIALLDWQQAFQHVAAMNAANGGAGTYGYNDWRVPTLAEMQSLVDSTRTSPALPVGHPFTDVELNYYWSSTASTGSFNYVYGINIANGVAYGEHDYNGGLIWPTRGGETASSPLAAGRTGSAYSQYLSLGSGIPPYSWSLTSGVLPPGLALTSANGRIAGTPTKPGVYSFTVRALDKVGVSYGKRVSMVIHDTPCFDAPVRIDGESAPYADIPDAYGAALDYDTIMLQALDFSSDLLFNRNIDVTVEGGYDCGYNEEGGASGITGMLRITRGKVRLERVRLL